MSVRREPLPAPDLTGTDPDEVLRSRIDFQSAVSGEGGRVARVSRGGTRPDPPGMRRFSVYVTQNAAEALEQAADRFLALVGSETPRHVALSALLVAGARQADTVAMGLARQREAELTRRLAEFSCKPE